MVCKRAYCLQFNTFIIWSETTSTYTPNYPLNGQIGAEYAASLDDQETQVDSLTALDGAVQEVTEEKQDPTYFKHLSIQVKSHIYACMRVCVCANVCYWCVTRCSNDVPHMR